MAAKRQATATWNGDLFSGNGTVSGKSGALNDLAVTWAARTESSDGKTSPEELVAAAHASCYAMALSNTLAQAGHAPESLDVTSVVTFDPQAEGGPKVTTAELSVTGKVPGISESEFEDLAKKGEQGCPISNLIRGGAKITLDAHLAK
jgi:osmotically inducible protein OsmC